MQSGDPAVKTDHQAYEQWWKVFNDPTLDRLIDIAYRQNLTLQQRKTEEAQSALAVEKAQQKKIYRRPWFWGVIGGGVGLVVAIGLGIGVSQLSYHTQGGTLTFTPVTP